MIYNKITYLYLNVLYAIRHTKTFSSQFYKVVYLTYNLPLLV